MKKQFRRVFAIVGILAILVGVWVILKTHNKQQLAPNGFTSPDGSFSTSLPNAWRAQIAESNKGAILATMVTDSIQSTSNLKPYINFAKGGVKGDLPTVYAETRQKYEKLFKNFQVTQESDIILWWQPAKQLVFNGIIWGKMLRYMIVMAIFNGEVYTVTASATQADYPQVEPVLAELVAKWQFIQQQ